MVDERTPGVPPRRVLLVEDDPALVGLLAEVFSDAGYDVDSCRDGHTALHRVLVDRYDVLVVDRGLPAIEGADLVRRVRGRGVRTPVLMLTARGTTQDRVEGLDAGAEDYLVKPFEIDELLARVRALLRRSVDTQPELEVAGGVLEPDEQRVRLTDGREVLLSRRESELLEQLARHPERTYSRRDLCELVFPEAEGAGVVDTYVYYLRRKLGRPVVQTVHGVGYRAGVAS